MTNVLLKMGAVVASHIGEIQEGAAPERVFGARALPDTDYVLLAGKAYRHEVIRNDDPAGLSVRAHLYGGWAVLPFDRIGEATTLLLSEIRELAGEGKTQITVEPMPHSEIRQLWPDVGSGGE